MEWFSQNWVWVVIGVAFVAMHMFGHGGHGGHGSDGGHGGRRGGCGNKTGREPVEARDEDTSSVHRH